MSLTHLRKGKQFVYRLTKQNLYETYLKQGDLEEPYLLPTK